MIMKKRSEEENEVKILLIEDDEDLCKAVKVSLKKEGYEVDICNTGEEAEYYINSWQAGIVYPNCIYDVIILDRMLPEIDGLTILETIRKKQITAAVIMVTALNAIGDRIDGLDAGADDYLAKPFEIDELLARIRAVLRRPREIKPRFVLTYSDLNYDCNQCTLTNHIQTITLSKREGALMELFFKNQNQILSREQILARVWGPDNIVEEGNIDNYIYFLRRRLKAMQTKAVIKTIRGIGYRLEEIK